MFVIAIGFEGDDEVMMATYATFDQMWEVKVDFEEAGFDVEWEYEP